MFITQNEFVRITKSQNLPNEKHEESMRRMEGKTSNLSQQITLLMQERGKYYEIELRNRTIPSVQKESTHKKESRKE